MTPLRQRMIDAMVQRGFAARTQESYVDAIVRMSRYYGRDPATYAAADVEAYLLHLIKEKKLSYSTVNQAAYASRFLFETENNRNNRGQTTIIFHGHHGSSQFLFHRGPLLTHLRTPQNNSTLTPNNTRRGFILGF